MTINPLPPQAYTKETLQKAYTWLLNQSPSVKDMATSQDMLISLYLKAQRNGDASLDTPSIQNFKLELKNLASLIGDLQTPPAPTHNHASNQAHPTPSAMNGAMNNALTPPKTPAIVNSSAILSQLDAQSLSAISEVKQTLNLSSDAEALRALISLGHKQFKKIY